MQRLDPRNACSKSTLPAGNQEKTELGSPTSILSVSHDFMLSPYRSLSIHNSRKPEITEIKIYQISSQMFACFLINYSQIVTAARICNLLLETVASGFCYLNY